MIPVNTTSIPPINAKLKSLSIDIIFLLIYWYLKLKARHKNLNYTFNNLEMKKESKIDENIRRKLRKDKYQVVLDELAKISDYNVGYLRRAPVMKIVAQRLFPYRKDGVRKTISAVEALSKPDLGVIEDSFEGNIIRITKTTLMYARK